MDGFWRFVGWLVLVAFVAEVSHAAAVAVVIVSFAFWLSARILAEALRPSRREEERKAVRRGR